MVGCREQFCQPADAQVALDRVITLLALIAQVPDFGHTLDGVLIGALLLVGGWWLQFRRVLRIVRNRGGVWGLLPCCLSPAGNALLTLTPYRRRQRGQVFRHIIPRSGAEPHGPDII